MSFSNPTFMEIFIEKWLNNKIGVPVYNGYVKKLNLRGDEKVLEFGCGGGTCSKLMAKRLLKKGFLTCVDTSPFWIKKAQERMKNYKNVEFLLGDIGTLHIKDHYYDIVSIHFVLHDIEEYLRQNIIDVLSSKLKRNGKLYIREPIKKSHGMPFEEIRMLMKKSGLSENDFKIDKRKYTGVFIK
ncbi:class I SAM-dependent methyltransferase [Crassaminicella profunda]|uniref:class I SAM-dependent methyltransferase n=1 Tax=Crassaminicella profunda TaxID=1286698 RepID=UPI001CA69C9A|nr:class I SAM-dependent methyltransferase [Crassaminicella profunda]QZY55070.1 class I SAM-dependent methyltransferase [Crassaminicella profunda]